MPSELNRGSLFAAAAAFLVALAVAYALSSTGQASPGSGPPGSPAQPLDVASGIAGQSTLGEAQALPALVHKPKPKPAPKREPAQNVSEPASPEPTTPAPVYHAPAPTPAPVTPTPSPAPAPAPTPEVFSDSG
jgi:outer membrane biosynthesis protein TonB